MTGLDSGAVRRSFFEEVFPLSIFSLPVACFFSANTYAAKIQLNTKLLTQSFSDLDFKTSNKCKFQIKIKRSKEGLELQEK